MLCNFVDKVCPDKYFTNVNENLKLKHSPHFCDLNDILIYYFQNHTIITKIASLVNSENDSVPEMIDFKPVTPEELKKETSNLDSKREPSKIYISAIFLTNPISTHLAFLTSITSSYAEKKEFPDELKTADFVPISKKGSF